MTSRDRMSRTAAGYDWKTEIPGVFSRHDENCPVRDGRDCLCGPLGYSASVRDWQTDERVVSPVLPSLPAAVAWQRDRLAGQVLASGTSAEPVNLSGLIDDFPDAAETGRQRDRSNHRYGHEAVRTLRGALSY